MILFSFNTYLWVSLCSAFRLTSCCLSCCWNSWPCLSAFSTFSALCLACHLSSSSCRWSIMGVTMGLWLFPNWTLEERPGPEVEMDEGPPEDEYGPDWGMSSGVSLGLSVLRDDRCKNEQTCASQSRTSIRISFICSKHTRRTKIATSFMIHYYEGTLL